MPDQHAAATEHDLLTTITEPLRKLPDDPLAVVAVDFPIALRGYDRIAVDAYVEHTAQLVAELQATRSPEAAVRRAIERVGEEISGILKRAHDTADEITARSRSEAEERLELARHEAIEITAQAELRVKELDAETERIWAERHSIVVDARELAGRLTELAESALERFPAAPPPESAGLAVEIASGEAGDDDITIRAAAVEGPVSPHLFDGAVEVSPSPESAAADELTFEEEPIEDDPAVEEPTVEGSERSKVDQPTVDLPPIPPWETPHGPLGPDEA
jgi:hypothetical protein